MTFWSDQRNHLLDDLLRDALLAMVAIAVGVAPGQFVALVIASRVLQSLQHANLRWRWPGGLERVLVSPSFHRLHHAMGIGHEGPARGVNFAVLFPVWDVLFRTADWRPGFIDYLYLSLTNMTAFSPTDTMPLSSRAKMLMGLQSVCGFILLALVIARSVNILA
jgi:hypothetical protein